VQARSAREATVILVDDLHWVDPASDEFVAQLADVVRGTRTLLLVNFRPEYSADWLRRSHVDKLALSPLGEQAIAELVRDLLGSDPSVAALPARIHQRTGGNPFFTEEVIQALIESGNLAGARGAFKLVTSVDAIQIPDQVQLILAARIDRLAEREKQVLHAAAVIGRNFDAELLAAVAELPARELSAALELLDAAEMIHATSLYPVAEYTFKHPLTHEVATSSQLARPRQRRHAAVAKALEARHAGKLDEHAALLAYHCEEAGLPLEAAEWHRRAAEWIGFNDVEESLRHWHRILDLIEDEPDAEVAEIGLLSAQQTLHVGGQNGISSEVAARVFERGNRWAAQSRSPDARAELLHAYGMALALTGEIAPGLEAMERALAGTIHDADLRIKVEMVSGWGQQNVGRLHQARATLEALIAGDFRSARTVMGYPARVFAHGIYAWVLHEMGMFSAAERATATSRRLAAEIGRNDLPFIALQESLEVAHRGELEAAARMAGEAVAMARAQHNANITSVGMLHLGEIHALRGSWSDAQSALEESLQIARESGTTLNLEARMLAPLARAHLAQGEPARALATAEEAIAVARKRGARHHEALALIAHAEVMLGTAGAARREEIESALIAAATLIEETGAALYELDLVRVRELARTELER
jgi:adenylate cyclase